MVFVQGIIRHLIVRKGVRIFLSRLIKYVYSEDYIGRMTGLRRENGMVRVLLRGRGRARKLMVRGNERSGSKRRGNAGGELSLEGIRRLRSR